MPKTFLTRYFESEKYRIIKHAVSCDTEVLLLEKKGKFYATEGTRVAPGKIHLKIIHCIDQEQCLKKYKELASKFVPEHLL